MISDPISPRNKKRPRELKSRSSELLDELYNGPDSKTSSQSETLKPGQNDKQGQKSVRSSSSAIKRVAWLALLAIIVGRLVIVSGSDRGVLGENSLNDVIATAEGDIQLLSPSKNQDVDKQIDQEAKVATYQDEISDLPITITQQPIPDDLADPGDLFILAKSLSATDSIVQFDTKQGIAYLVEASSFGSTVIFRTTDLLVTLTSDEDISVAQWELYVDRLEF